jgi:hypothetical protein
MLSVQTHLTKFIRIVSVREVWTNKISLSSPLLFEVHQSQESERSCIYVKVSILLKLLQFSI